MRKLNNIDIKTKTFANVFGKNQTSRQSWEQTANQFSHEVWNNIYRKYWERHIEQFWIQNGCRVLMQVEADEQIEKIYEKS